MELILNLNRRLNMAVILITHDLAIVAETCSRVLVMYLGQIVEEAPVCDLFAHPRHPYTLALLKSVPMITGERPDRLYSIEGSVPLLSQIPQGCRFAPRCPYAEEQCRKENPSLVPVTEFHKSRCRRAGIL
jgi:oligopeptide/dipeptide ABC transporter ATP-binding protein